MTLPLESCAFVTARQNTLLAPSERHESPIAIGTTNDTLGAADFIQKERIYGFWETVLICYPELVTLEPYDSQISRSLPCRE